MICYCNQELVLSDAQPLTNSVYPELQRWQCSDDHIYLLVSGQNITAYALYYGQYMLRYDAGYTFTELRNLSDNKIIMTFPGQFPVPIKDKQIQADNLINRLLKLTAFS